MGTGSTSVATLTAVTALNGFGSLLTSAFLTRFLVVQTLIVSAHHSPPAVKRYTKQIVFIGFIGKLTPNSIKVIKVKDCA
jgi:hypothetical protein